MRTEDYSEVLRGTAALAGMLPADVGNAEFGLISKFHDRRLRYAWEIHEWPDLCPLEQRFLQTTATGRVVPYDFNTTLIGAGIVSGTYSIGAGVWYGQVSGLALPYTPVRAILSVRTTPGGYVMFPTMVDGTLSADGFQFILSGMTDSANYILDYVLYADGVKAVPGPSGSVPLPPGVWSWNVQGLLLGYTPAQVLVRVRTTIGAMNLFADVVDGSITSDGFTAALSAMTDSGNYILDWQAAGPVGGMLPLGEILRATDKDPRGTTKLEDLPYDLQQDGIYFPQVLQSLLSVWLKFRMRRSVLRGDPFDQTAVYLPGEQVYFVSPLPIWNPVSGNFANAGTGNFYSCVTQTTPGQSPYSNSANWQIVPIPYIFSEYLVDAGFADWLKQDGQNDKSQQEEGNAMSWLELEADKLQRQQRQVRRFTIKR